MKLSDKTLIFLALIIFLAAFLRFYRIGDIPPALYTDEANQGYNAYSIMLTGRDEHGTFLPVSLRSFGDWKPPLPAYLMAPFIWVLGLGEVSVRLPSAFFGTLTILLTYWLVKEIFSNSSSSWPIWFKIKSTKLALLSSFFLAISPWHILQSRAAMLVAIGLFFLISGIYFFIKGVKNKFFLILSCLSFVLSIYSYYGLRIVTPFILLFLLIKYRKDLAGSIKQLVIPAILGLLLLLPLLFAFLAQPDVIFGRAKTVSIFYDQGVNLRKWELATQDGVGADTTITRFFHNNFYMYGRSIVQRFLSHIDGRFLFMIGDGSPPFQIPQMGILSFADLAFIPLGILILFKQKYRSRWLIIFWIFVSILPAALSFVTPSSNRTFNAVAAYAILAAVGIVYLVYRSPIKVLVSIIISLFYLSSLSYFLHQFFVSLPLHYADFWNYGWKQVVGYVAEEENKFSNIIVSDQFGMPYIYFLFYNKYPPFLFQEGGVRPYVADRFGFEHVEEFGKYLFQNDFDWNFVKKNNLQKNTLYVVPASQAADDMDYTRAIYYPDGKIAFKIFAYE